MEKGRKHIVLFPYMAQGHILPFLALAQHMEQKGYAITFVNTPLNINKLHKSLPPSSSNIKLVEIPFNSSDHGLPPHSENSDALPYYLIPCLLTACPSLQLPFRNLLSNLIQEAGGEKPVCVVSDMFFGWCADVAHEFGIFHAIFSTSGGFGMACFYSEWVNLPYKVLSGNAVEYTLPDFTEAGTFHVTQLSAADGLLLNTVEELNKTATTYFQRKLGIPVWSIGPLLLSSEDRARIGSQSTISPEKCIQWLDQKEPNSVIYISFGSQNTISASQMEKLAKALDASGKNFIWVVRPPFGFDTNKEFVVEDWLPEGFLQSVQDQERGLIVKKWAPQVEILAHKSVSAFVSHCGWNSVLESLKNRVPLIGWPMHADQFYNAKWLVEEVGVCVEVARGSNFEIKEEDIMEKIELVMGENEKGKEIRRKACEVKEIMRDAIRDDGDYKGSSVKAMEGFFIAALQGRERATAVSQSK
ncbi:UNVERIFIED_CONTAM: UDP-glycosyltransferase 92A1 [Sesamum calycinum]|uniref:Glycosyltransferase n=1 Tax=Sesamum calycinum TaxID=2727403 RepID=A0AAW2JZX3_9LAMI